jgi:hypothetical protein
MDEYNHYTRNKKSTRKPVKIHKQWDIYMYNGLDLVEYAYTVWTKQILIIGTQKIVSTFVHNNTDRPVSCVSNMVNRLTNREAMRYDGRLTQSLQYIMHKC